MSETFFFFSWKFMVITRLLEISLTRRLANIHMEYWQIFIWNQPGNTHLAIEFLSSDRIKTMREPNIFYLII